MNEVRHIQESLMRTAEQAIQMLITKHDASFVILYGSLVRGDANELSDIDVACFCDNPKETHDTQSFNDKHLDGWIYGKDDMKQDRVDFLRFAGGKVFGKDLEEGIQFLKTIEEKLIKGPKPMTHSEQNHLKQWVFKTLERTQRADIEAKFRRNDLSTQLLEIYFQLRDRWYLGSKSSFHWLKQHDADGYKLFSNVLENPSNLTDLKKLAHHVVNHS